MLERWRISLKSLEQRGIFLAECAILAGAVFWAESNQDTAWRGAGLGLTLIIALWAWRRALTRAGTIGNTPADRIASTAQGYTRLAGRGQLLEGRQRVFEPGTGLPCLWYRVNYRPSGSREVEREQSDASFLLDDGSGAVCAVDPEGAEMLVRRRHAEYLEDGAYVEYWSLRPGDRICVLGEFVTLGSIDPDLDIHHQTGELLDLWKADRPALLRRFDLNDDGEINPQEWDLARAAARREVQRAQQEALTALEAHIMRTPSNGLPYLISDRDLDALARRFQLWAIVHGLVFIACAAALAWLYSRGGRGI